MKSSSLLEFASFTAATAAVAFLWTTARRCTLRDDHSEPDQTPSIPPIVVSADLAAGSSHEALSVSASNLHVINDVEYFDVQLAQLELALAHMLYELEVGMEPI